MRSRHRILTLSVLIMIGIVLPLAAPVTAQDGTPTRATAFGALLNTVPDTPAAREWLTYGDIAAWHSSWDVPRIDSAAELEAGPREPRAYWQLIMPKQTTPPSVLGLRYYKQDDYRAFYGFDLFQVDRVIAAGAPPDEVAVLEHSADPVSIAAQLIASGYTAEERAHGWTLYRILDDYEGAWEHEDALPGLPRAGLTGELNRIALKGQQLIIARASAPIDAVIDAFAASTSLADDPVYRAVSQALDDALLADTGEIVGVMMQPGTDYAGDIITGALNVRATPEQRDAFMTTYGLDDPARLLPPFDLVAFVTSHSATGTYLTLAVAFPVGSDAARAVDVLSEKLPGYIMVSNERALAEEWTLHRAGTVTVDEIPVALVTLHVDDPPPTPADEMMVYAHVFDWQTLIMRRDTLFLARTDSVP